MSARWTGDRLGSVISGLCKANTWQHLTPPHSHNSSQVLEVDWECWHNRVCREGHKAEGGEGRRLQNSTACEHKIIEAQLATRGGGSGRHVGCQTERRQFQSPYSSLSSFFGSDSGTICPSLRAFFFFSFSFWPFIIFFLPFFFVSPCVFEGEQYTRTPRPRFAYPICHSRVYKDFLLKRCRV